MIKRGSKVRAVKMDTADDMGNGITPLDMDTSDAYTKVFLQGQSLVRISREMGLQKGWARDAYKKPGLERVPAVRFQCVRGHEVMKEDRV